MPPMRTVPPPTSRQRLNLLLFAHPFEMALGGILVVNGIRFALDTQTASASVAELPPWALAVYVLVSMAGGILTLTGLWVGERRNGRGLEASGLWMVAASYAGFGFLITALYGTLAITTALVCGVVASACILRARAIRKTQTIILETLREGAQDHSRGANL